MPIYSFLTKLAKKSLIYNIFLLLKCSGYLIAGTSLGSASLTFIGTA